MIEVSLEFTARYSSAIGICYKFQRTIEASSDRLALLDALDARWEVGQARRNARNLLSKREK